MMSNPCECCQGQGKIKFIRKINGNSMHSMVMPECILNYFGGKAPVAVTLEAPNGIRYDVTVTQNMNRTILNSGWAAFVDANQIKENYSLMFRYLGNAHFKVTIFDSNGIEKGMCCAAIKTASDMQKPNSRYADNSDSSEGASELLFMLPQKTHLTQAQKKKVLEKVSAIKSELPIYVAVMSKRSVRGDRGGSQFSFGVRYVSRYLKKKYASGHYGKRNAGISLVLQTEGKSKMWPTELRSGGRVNLTGWPSFAGANGLRKNDLCLFKLMENEEPLKMMVYIIRREEC